MVLNLMIIGLAITLDPLALVPFILILVVQAKLPAPKPGNQAGLLGCER